MFGVCHKRVGAAVASFIFSGLLGLAPLFGEVVHSDSPGQIPSDLKVFIRAVSSGQIQVDEMGVLSPFFTQFSRLGSFEDKDVFLALGRNAEHELILFGWLKSETALTLDQATSRWVEEMLGKVETEEQMSEWKAFRALLRGALHHVKEGDSLLQAVAFVGTLALFGPANEESLLQNLPTGFRFVSAQPTEEVLALRSTTFSLLKGL